MMWEGGGCVCLEDVGSVVCAWVMVVGREREREGEGERERERECVCERERVCV